MCDLTLLTQIYYYRYTSPSTTSSLSSPNTERSPLLEQPHPHPGHPRPQPTRSQPEDHKDTPEEDTPLRTQLLQYLAGFVFVIGTGVAAWYLTRVSHSGNQPGDGNGNGNADVPQKDSDILEWKSQVFGWISAAMYRVCPSKFISTPLTLIILFSQWVPVSPKSVSLPAHPSPFSLNGIY